MQRYCSREGVNATALRITANDYEHPRSGDRRARKAHSSAGVLRDRTADRYFRMASAGHSAPSPKLLIDGHTTP